MECDGKDCGESDDNVSDGVEGLSDSDDGDGVSDGDREGECVSISAMLAVNDISELVLNEDKLPTHITNSRKYRTEKKKFVLSQFEDKDSQEIVSHLSQVPESVCTFQFMEYDTPSSENYVIFENL